MIIEIALGIVLAIIIVAFLPAILGVGLMLLCLAIAAAGIYILFFSQGVDRGLINLMAIVGVLAFFVLPPLMLEVGDKLARRLFGKQVDRLESTAGMSLQSMAKTGVIGVCCLLFAGYAVVNLVSHGHGDVAVLATIIAAVMCAGLFLFVGQERKKFVPPQPPSQDSESRRVE